LNIRTLDKVPTNHTYNKFAFINVMSNNSKKMVFASVMGVILATGILAINPSIIGNAQAQSYGYNDQYSYDGNYYKDDNRYGYDGNYYQDDNRNSYDNKHQKKSSHTDIQKIKCVNSNINVNGIDITQIPQEDTATTAANEAGSEAENTQNGNGLADRINFDRNLVNICINLNENEQVKVTPPDGEPEPTATLNVKKVVTCEDFSGSTASPCTRVEELVTEDQFIIEVTGNDPKPSLFLASEAGTDVKLNPGIYQVEEIFKQSVNDELSQLENEFPGVFFLLSGPIFSGDCTGADPFRAEGTIGEGESKTCDIENRYQVFNESQ
jgi:hypothetical protein